MTRNLESLNEEVSALYEIKGKLRTGNLKEEDVSKLKELADVNKSPLAEYLYGAIHFFGKVVEEDRATAYKYFDLSRAHASGPIQMKMAEIYFNQSEEYWDRGYECVVAAAKDRHPIARKIVRMAKRNFIRSLFYFG